MSSPFTYTTTTPAANESPGTVSRPAMQQNFASINGLIAVEHIPFNNTTGGLHKQVTFLQPTSPSAPTNPTTILYSGDGVAATNPPQIYAINNSGTIPVSCIKAFGNFSTAPPPIPPAPPVVTVNNTYNVESIAYTTSLRYTVTLTSGCYVAGASPLTPLVFIFVNSGASATYSLTSDTLLINLSSALAGNISFMLVQI